jgi:hypothetical protein
MLPCDWREWRAAARVSPRAPAGCLGPAHEGSGLHEVSLLVERPQSGVQQYAEPARGEAIGTSAGGGASWPRRISNWRESLAGMRRGVGGEFSQQGGGRRGYTDQVRCADQARCSGTGLIHRPGGVKPNSGRRREATRGGGRARRCDLARFRVKSQESGVGHGAAARDGGGARRRG